MRIKLKNSEYGDESIIIRNGALEVRVPAAPESCDYIRVIRRIGKNHHEELVYWNSEEWTNDPERICIGAIMGAMKEVAEGRSSAFKFKKGMT